MEPTKNPRSKPERPSQPMLEAARFIGETLGPPFLLDPQQDADALEPLLAAFSSLDVSPAAQDWPTDDKNAAESALQSLREGARQATASPEGAASLTWEYRRLFVGPGPKAAPPWGSVYTDKESVVFGESTLALRQWMRAEGIARLAPPAEPEDHIGLMLLLVAWVAQHRPPALAPLLSEHLLPWGPHLLEGMAAAAAHPFYQGLASITETSLRGLSADLGLTVSEPRFYR